MNNSNFNKKARYNYCKYDEPSQIVESTSDSTSNKVPDPPAPPAKPFASPNTKAPAPFAYPKHPAPSRMPAHPEKPNTSQIKSDANTPVEVNNKPLGAAPVKKVPSKSDSVKSVYRDEWWLKYDEHLRKMLGQ